MDWLALTLNNFDGNFFVGLANIIIIDIVLAGDNAVIIAMAVRSLPREQQRRIGIILGAGAAVVLRGTLTFFVSQLLAINFIKFVGGGLIAWIAIKLLVQDSPEQESGKNVATLWQTIRLIVIADITMSLDNVLAVAGASQGNFLLLLLGLALSIPCIILTSSLLSSLMDRYPIIIYLGTFILGRVAAEMMISDPYVEQYLQFSVWQNYIIEGIFAMGITIASLFYLKRKSFTRLALRQANTILREDKRKDKN